MITIIAAMFFGKLPTQLGIPAWAILVTAIFEAIAWLQAREIESLKAQLARRCMSQKIHGRDYDNV